MCDNSEFNITTQRFRELIDNEKYAKVPRAEIAKALNCDTSTITKYYNGQRQLSVDSIIKFSKYFNVSSDYLLGLTDSATTDADIKSICEYTGLNENTVDALNFAKSFITSDGAFTRDYEYLFMFINDYIVYITEDNQRYNLSSLFNCTNEFEKQLKVLNSECEKILSDFNNIAPDDFINKEKYCDAVVEVYNKIFGLYYSSNALINGMLFSISQDLTDLLKKYSEVYKIPNALKVLLNTMEETFGFSKT